MMDLGITAEEWLFLQLLFLAKEGHSEYLHKYFVEVKKDVIPRKTIEIFIEKNIIDKKYKIPSEGQSFDPSQIPLSESTLKKYFKSSLELGQELLDIFPPFIHGKNGSYPIKNISKFYRSLEDFCFAYSKAIKFNPEKHNEVIDLLKWAIENGLITFNIVEFVISHKWEDLKKIKDGGTSINVKFDNLELL